MPNGNNDAERRLTTLQDLIAGTIDRNQAALQLLSAGVLPDRIDSLMTEALEAHRRGDLEGLKNLAGYSPDITAQEAATLKAREEETDPQTAYLERLGIGGKQFYNPAERYQAGLFDPFMDIWNVQQRLYGQGGPLGGADVLPGERPAGTFQQFLNRTGSGLGSLTQAATGQLRNIFGAPAETRGTLGYEPGQYLPDQTAGVQGGGLNPGELRELQNLMRYGLRPTSGPMGAQYAAQRLPQAQQAYYGGKTAGTITEESFLDWLNKNWGLGF